jgi:antagonist of KipI
MDRNALRAINAILANNENAAGIEWALTGGELTFSERTTVAIGGAQVAAKLNDKTVDRYRAYLASAGDKLTIESITTGRFLYIAVSGGIDTPAVMNSRSTYVPGSIGGRRLKTGDEIGTVNQKRTRHQVLDSLPLSLQPSYESRPVRIVARDDPGEITNGELTISTSSDRTGYRLGGRMIFGGASITSTGVCPGTIQLPPGGEPIVLMADAPTVGGYRVVGCVISADLGRLAQLAPGASVLFEEVTVETAQREVRIDAERLETIREWALG